MLGTFEKAFIEVNASLRHTQILCFQIDDNLPGSITCCCNSLPLHLSLLCSLSLEQELEDQFEQEVEREAQLCPQVESLVVDGGRLADQCLTSMY